MRKLLFIFVAIAFLSSIAFADSTNKPRFWQDDPEEGQFWVMDEDGVSYNTSEIDISALNLGDELLSDTEDFSGNWTLGGDWDLATKAFEYNDATHSGALTQANADLDGTLVASTWYLLQYTLTDATTPVAATSIVATLGTSAINVELGAVQTYYYLIKSDAVVTGDDFIITVTASTAGDIAGNMMSLREVQDGVAVFKELQVTNDAKVEGSGWIGGTLYTNYLAEYTSGSGITLKDDLKVNQFTVVEDGGYVAVMDMSVSATPIDGTLEGYSYQLDSNAAFDVACYANSAGGIYGEYIETHGWTRRACKYFIEDFENLSQTNYDENWDTASLITGTGTNVVTTTVSRLTLTTDGAGANEFEGTRSLYAVVTRAKVNRSEWLVDLGQLTTTNFYLGWNDDAANAMVANADKYVIVYYEVGTANWQIKVGDGTDEETYTSSTVASTNDITHELWVETDGTVHWAINGVEEDITSGVSSNLMDAAAHYIVVGQLETTDGTAVTAEADYIENDRLK